MAASPAAAFWGAEGALGSLWTTWSFFCLSSGFWKEGKSSGLLSHVPGALRSQPLLWLLGAFSPGGIQCSFPSPDPFSSSPGDTQLWPWRVWDHHPLGLCHGSSQALWEHPPGEAAGQSAAAPLVSCLLTWDYHDSSSLEVTAERCK